MSGLREAAQQALEALEERYVGALRDKAMDALRAALAHPEQEPVAWMYVPAVGDGPRERRVTFIHPAEWGTTLGLNITPLYTHPPRREWRGLTDEVIAELWHQNAGFHHHFARAVERWLKKKA